MTAPVFKQITIIGVGLIGGSIARAALEKGAAGEVVLFDGNATR
jgi:cyclohexadieny/prephenate dehydrogenase